MNEETNEYTIKEWRCPNCELRYLIEAPFGNGSRLHIVGNFENTCQGCKDRLGRMQSGMEAGLFDEVKVGKVYDPRP